MPSPFSQMGLAATSFGGAIYGITTVGNSQTREAALATVPIVPGSPNARHADTIEFLDRCHALGAAGVQTQVNGDPYMVRARAEELGMWVEGLVSIRNSTTEQLERAILDAKAAGCTVARDAMLSGRRYETFQSFAEWQSWVSESHTIIERVLPLLEKHKFTVALENHKDWTADEYAALFRKYSCEYLGACVDFGNNLSLLDGPMELVERAAPFVKSTHIKDMDVRRSDDGFEMAEVPLGQGILDLPKMISVVRSANPRIQFSLEMITRDPLPVPCLSDQYWETFPDRNGSYLARAMRLAESRGGKGPLPTVEGLSAVERKQIEEDNIRACFQYSVDGP